MHALVTHSAFYRTVLWIAVAVWAIPEWIGTYFQRSERGAARHDRGSQAVLVAGMIVAMVAAIACVNAVPRATIAWRQPLVFWLGIALMLAGIAFRWYAIRVLGRFFTRDVATRAGQTVIAHGPYRLIRHPSYSGALATTLGLGLALTNWLALLILVAAALIGFGYRVHVEERALCTALGEPYREYMKRTRRFIPYLW